jgi:hypothetical protein
MHDDDLDQRLAEASARLVMLDGALQAGGPWPLAARFDHAPEASWGPREILAHLEEMLPYWLGEAERVLDAGGAPVTFGRVATNELRLALIERDRTLPLRELVARVQVGLERWRRRWAELDTASRTRAGSHVALGELTVTQIATRSVVDHVEGHLDQLAAALSGDQTPG